MVDFSERELNTAEFKGYVKHSLESIDDKLKGLDSKMDLLDSCVNGIKIKIAAIGGTVSLVVTVVILLLTKQI